MAWNNDASVSLPRAASISVLLLALLSAPASAKVGVTSATDGDPLGKPPQQNERVLRIGIDVQADEVVTTNATDRAHLVFLDGTSLTVGPDARVVIDRFVYDPDSKKGELALTVGKGVFRLVGGKISKTNAINVTTPSSTIGIRGGISIFTVTSVQTTAAFVFGNSMTVASGGQTLTITRPGFQTVSNIGGPPGPASGIPRGGLSGALGALEGGTNQGGGNADQQAQSSGFSNQNSGQPGNLNPPPPQTFTSITTSNAVINSVTGPGTQRQPDETQSPPANNATPPSARTTRTMNGYAAGLITNINGESQQTRLPLLGKPNDVSITTDATTGQVAGSVKGTIVIRQLQGNAVNTLELGGTSTTALFVDDKTFGMVTTNDPIRPSTVKVGNQTFVIQDSTALATGLPPGVTLVGTAGSCTCEYLTYGWWGTAISYTNGFRSNQADVIPIAPFVVGTLTTSVQMPQTGHATYNGAMAGTVLNNGNAYGALGSYSSTWSFAARAGSFNATFDGAQYVGGAIAQPGSGGVTFSGAFVGGSGRFGALTGSFFNAPNQSAQYQAGSFGITNLPGTYKASGIFAGQRAP
jgi:hypothetical protein